jgi:Uma2 family endonuclease
MVMSNSQVVPFTYREYALLPDDGRWYELIDGDFLVSPSPSPSHQTVLRLLQFELMQQIEKTGTAFVFNAPCDLILSDTTVVQPDLVVVRQSRKEIITKRGIEGIPEIIVEIISPSSKERDEFLKKSLYSRFAIPEYWLVHQDLGFVSILRLDNNIYRLYKRFDCADILQSPEFPEISIPLAPIFRAL